MPDKNNGVEIVESQSILTPSLVLGAQRPISLANPPARPVSLAGAFGNLRADDKTGKRQPAAFAATLLAFLRQDVEGQYRRAYRYAFAIRSLEDARSSQSLG